MNMNLLGARWHAHATRHALRVACAFAAGVVLSGSICVGKADATGGGPVRIIKVSPRATGAGTGADWGNAVTKFAKLNWTSIRESLLTSDVQIELDGGSYYQDYADSLVVQASGSATHKLRVVTSEDAGYAGQVRLNGDLRNATLVGIDIGDNRFVEVIGRKITLFSRPARTIALRCYGGDGIRTGGNSRNVVLRNIEVSECGVYSSGIAAQGVGIRLQGQAHTVDRVILHDNGNTNMLMYLQGTARNTITNCWFSNYKKLITNNYMTYRSDGLRFDHAASSAKCYVQNCIFGPALKRGYVVNANGSNTDLSYSLFVNAGECNILKAAGRTAALAISHVTSFMTPMIGDPPVSHNCLDMTQQGELIHHNIFYGGNLRIPSVTNPGRITYNTQWRTTGDVSRLSSAANHNAIADPLFTTNAELLENQRPVSFSNILGVNTTMTELANAQFSLRTGSPALGRGSSLTSIEQFLNSL